MEPNTDVMELVKVCKELILEAKKMDIKLDFSPKKFIEKVVWDRF